LTTGSYKISIKSNKAYFEEKFVNIDLTGSGFLFEMGLPFQSISRLNKFVAKWFDVCGRVNILKESQGKSDGSLSNNDLAKAIQLKCIYDSTPKQTAVAALDQNLNFCFQLEANKFYTIITEISDSFMETHKSKLDFLQDEIKVNVIDEPLDDIYLSIKFQSKNDLVVIGMYSIPFVFLGGYSACSYYYSNYRANI